LHLVSPFLNQSLFCIRHYCYQSRWTFRAIIERGVPDREVSPTRQATLTGRFRPGKDALP